jgi:hypothetical protein
VFHRKGLSLRPGFLGRGLDLLGSRPSWRAGFRLGWDPGWSGKIEYLYIDLGHFTDNLNENYAVAFPGATRTVSGNMRENMFRIGLNYQFH